MHSAVQRLRRRLLGVSLTGKLLVAHGAIVTLWVATAWVVARASGDGPSVLQYELLGLVVLVSALLGVGASALILRSALAPLRELERVARAVENGDRRARARPRGVHDPQTDRVIAVTNTMLDAIEAQRREVERAADRLAQLSAREMQAREEERRAVARELLEDVGQSCAAMRLGLQVVANRLRRDAIEPETMRARIEGLLELARGIHDVVLLRAQGLRPSGLDDLGLVPALRSACLRWSAAYGRPVDLVDNDGPTRMASAVEITLFRVAEEAVANAAHHGQPSRIEVRVRQSARGVELRVADDGRGFDAARADAWALGLLGMRERLALVGGHLRIISHRGAGTTVVADVPVAPEPLARPDALGRADGAVALACGCRLIKE